MNEIKVLTVDDDREFNRVLARELGKTGFEVESIVDGRSLLPHLQTRPCDVILMDIHMPGSSGMELLSEVHKKFPLVKVIMLTGFGTIDSAVQAVKDGAFDYLTKPCDLSRIETVIRQAYRMSRLEQQNILLKQSRTKFPADLELIGESAPIQEIRTFITRVAQTNSSVLLLGESGVGKEVVATAIYRASDRRDQPFVVVDCGALQENLLASELFGHERGAYTGAFSLKHGLFEVASGGTVLLDEIGEISQAVQVKLLRVLDVGCYRRLGSNRDLYADVRIIASTNRNLHKDMTEGRLREDLYYRLKVIVATIPPLRDRRSDIPLLTEHFLRLLRDARGRQKRISPEALKCLQAYDWPGNVRELRNTLERLVILSPGDEIVPADLLKGIEIQTPNLHNSPREESLTLRKLEHDHIDRVLQITDGNHQQAASILGIDPKTLYRKLKDPDRA